MSIIKNMSLDYRKLAKEDARAYKLLRLEALTNQPEAFASSYEDEKDLSIEEFENRLSDGFTVGCFNDDDLIGIVTFFKPYANFVNLSHKGTVCAFYVQAKYRGQGIGTKLMKIVIELLPDDVTQLNLVLASDNINAKKFYEKFGFIEWGLEPNAVKLGSKFVDDYHMVKIFS